MEAIAEGNLDVALSQFEEDAKWNVGQALPEAGVHEGKNAIWSMLGAQRERFRGGYKLLNLSVHGTGSHAFAASATRCPYAPREHRPSTKRASISPDPDAQWGDRDGPVCLTTAQAVLNTLLDVLVHR